MEISIKKIKSSEFGPDIQEIVYIEGKINLYNRNRLDTFFMKNLERMHSPVIINLAQLEYIDSTGIGLFLKILSTAQGLHKELYFLDTRESILRIFKTTNISRFMRFMSTEEFQNQWNSSQKSS